MRRLAAASALVLACACAQQTTTTDAGADSAASDAALRDASLDAAASDGGGDAGSVVDAPLDARSGCADAGACIPIGRICATDCDCCSGACRGGVCDHVACTSDGASCTTDAECCGGSCAGGTCAALNTVCLTLGNGCTEDAACCSSLCQGGVCSASSFCGQTGEVCASGDDCCSGTCDATGALGTCAAPVTGTSTCDAVEGMICNGGCGATCCSHLCAPYAPTGAMVCQPPSGCHAAGDTCTRDLDCCGAVGLPGGSSAPATCMITAPSTIGVCHQTGCRPDGELCRLSTASCVGSCDCCSGNCGVTDTCQLDLAGVPRCAALACAGAGEACASSANCCNHAPCVPSASGAPPFVCAATCAAAGAACSADGDCCAGTACEHALGSAQGTCATRGAACGLTGQTCASDADCCGAVPCLDAASAPCTASAPGCTCHATFG